MNFAEEAARIADETLRVEQKLDLPRPMNVRERFLLYLWLALDRGLVRLPKPKKKKPNG